MGISQNSVSLILPLSELSFSICKIGVNNPYSSIKTVDTGMVRLCFLYSRRITRVLRTIWLGPYQGELLPVEYVQSKEGEVQLCHLKSENLEVGLGSPGTSVGSSNSMRFL